MTGQAPAPALPPASRILFTNNAIDGWTGSELYVRDVALELMRRGHLPVVYSTILGPLADELRAATIPVIDDLADLGEAPDVIHGHHHLDTVTATLWFPNTPAVFVTHGWTPWEELPPRMPSIRRYIAATQTGRERLLTRGVRSDDVDVIANFADLDRFQQRDPLPERPTRALSINNHTRQDDAFSTLLADVCRAEGIALDVVGLDNGNPVADPERVLGDYDLVFAIGRTAIEAMAVGAAVVVTGPDGLAAMVDPKNFDRMRSLNFTGRRLWTQPVNRAGLVAEIRKYDPEAARAVSDRIRSEASLSAAVDALERTYAAAMAPGPVKVDAHEQLRATARYLTELAPVLKHREQAVVAARTAQLERDLQQRRAAAAEDAVGRLRAELAQSRTEHEDAVAVLEDAMARLERALAASEDELAGIRASPAHALVFRLGRLRRRPRG